MLKRITTKHGSGQKKGVDTVACENTAIVGCNTNKTDLYGLIRAPEAERVQMVILWFKLKPEDLNWDDFKTEIGLNDAKCSEQDRFNLGYTLFHYLKYEYKIYDGFSVTKYFSKERDEIIQKLQKMSKNHLENWLTQLTLKDNYSDHAILEHKKDRNKNEYIAIKENQKSIDASFQKFRRDTGCDVNYKANTIITTLIEKGFEQIKTNGDRYLRIPKAKFEELIKCASDDITEIDENDFIDVETDSTEDSKKPETISTDGEKYLDN